MSRSIETVTISSVEDRQLQLSNAQAARVISIGTNWQSIRIGMRISFTDAGAAVTGTPRLWAGLLANPDAGLTNGPLSTTTSHFAGIRMEEATWARQTSPYTYYLCNSGTATRAVKKIGSTVTTSAGLNNIVNHSATPTAVRKIVIIEITKGSPNYTFDDAIPGTSSTAYDYTLDHLIACMENATMAGIKTYLNALSSTYATTTPVTLAVSAADGDLNAICIAWDRTNPSLRISDIMWAQIA